MKKLLSLIVLAACVVFCQSAVAQEATSKEPAVSKDLKSFSVYSDSRSSDNHYIPSGWMGDYGDLSMDDKYMSEPHSGSTCIKFVYTAKKTQNQSWGGVYWQNPANNWGSKKGGFDLSGLNKLTFWVKGAKGGEIIDKVVVGGLKGTYPDTAEVSVGPIELTSQWQQYTINLAGKEIGRASCRERVYVLV